MKKDTKATSLLLGILFAGLLLLFGCGGSGGSSGSDAPGKCIIGQSTIGNCTI